LIIEFEECMLGCCNRIIGVRVFQRHGEESYI